MTEKEGIPTIPVGELAVALSYSPTDQYVSVLNLDSNSLELVS